MKQSIVLMFPKYFLFVISFNLIAQSNLLDITQLGVEQYQNIVINGNILANMPPTNGQRPEKRYEVIKPFLQLYKRPFTMLDIGAAQGYHSLRAAWEFPDSVFVMLEGNNPAYPYQGDQLLSICKCNTELNNIIHLNKDLYLNDLIRLGECEHFDVVLVLNILHWLGDEWESAADALLYLGDNIIIETPPAHESARCKNIIQYLESLGAEKIAEVPRHVANKKSPMYLLKSDKAKTLKRSTWITSPEISSIREYIIISDFSEKKLRKLDVTHEPYTEVIMPWDPGINLMTFKMYNGAYPLAETLKEALYRLKDEPHNDWRPNNFIVQGSCLKMIDYNSIYFSNEALLPTTYARYNKMLKLMEETDPKKIVALFYKIADKPRVY